MELSTYHLTPASLKVLAHPIRVKLLGELRLDGPATATGLAAKIGESSGTTSYHLRQLAAVDLVVEDTERGNARDRWWRAAQDSTRLDSKDGFDEQDVQTYLTAILQGYVDRSWTWLSRWAEAPKRWRESSTMSDARLSLSATELAQLNADIEALVESRRREPKRGDKQVAVQWQSYPLDAS